MRKMNARETREAVLTRIMRKIAEMTAEEIKRFIQLCRQEGIMLIVKDK